MNSHWLFFAKAVVDPVRSRESGHWMGNAQFFGLKVGCAAIAAIRAWLSNGASWSQPVIRKSKGFRAGLEGSPDSKGSIVAIANTTIALQGG